MISEKQEQANLQNAQLSTGPVTHEGKAIVARNAIKHGIFAKDLVITAGDGQEDEMEYHLLFSELKKDLGPVGRMEMLLVEKIAVNYWRQRRLLRYETGGIRERLDNFRESALSSYYSSSHYSRQRPDLQHFNYGDDISDTEYQNQLYKVAVMRSSGFKPAEERVALEYVLCWRLNREEAEFSDKDYKAAEKYVKDLSPQMQGKLRKEILEDAEQLLVEMEEVRTWRVKFDRLQKSQSLPKVLGLNNIIKYENSLERSIFRNLATLKVLQENRGNRGRTEQLEDDLHELLASG